MAHYLDRHFGDAKDVFVLHDLRVVLEGEAAQMDHLVLHAFGAAIVESKSVSTSVRVNSAGEWERLWDGRWQGMADPVLQGERQGMLLKKLLVGRQTELLDKAIFGLLQGSFKHMALDVFAGISDEGTIQRAEKGQAPRVLKADAVPNAILDAIAAYRSANDALRSSLKEARSAPRVFKDAEMMRVAHFLRTRHVETGDASSTVDTASHAPVDAGVDAPRANRHPGSSPEAASATPPTVPRDPSGAAVAGDGDHVVIVCKACKGTDLEARIGRYGPYGRCRSCGTDTSVRMRCAGCRAKVRVERATGGFAGVCGACSRPLSVGVGH